ncbi:transposase [Streptomyces sp. WAC 04229]|uniref:transposase n=1 Tax=Streptomyces sp. WAC 04229 TaxID=2203206 RepID=UPI003D726AE0
MDGIRFRVRTGIPWRDLPVKYGPRVRAYDLFRQWHGEGTRYRIFTALQARDDAKGGGPFADEDAPAVGSFRALLFHAHRCVPGDDVQGDGGESGRVGVLGPDPGSWSFLTITVVSPLWRWSAPGMHGPLHRHDGA